MLLLTKIVSHLIVMVQYTYCQRIFFILYWIKLNTLFTFTLKYNSSHWILGVSINASQKNVILMKSHNISYERLMFNQIKAIFPTYFLHNLQGHVSGFLPLISLLNSRKDLQFLIFWCTRAHILLPRNLAYWKWHEDLYFRSIIKVHY